MKNKVIVVGSGKLARAVLETLHQDQQLNLSTWENRNTNIAEASIIVHAGSGRQLPEVYEFCKSTRSVLIELATGTATGNGAFSFPIVLCPNTSLLMIKFLAMLKHFKNPSHSFEIALLESHQSSKKSLPGTAVEIANAIGLPQDNILSVRNPEVQSKQLNIPTEFLPKHAYHKLSLKDGSVSIEIETNVLGHDSYGSGVAAIIAAVGNRELENRIYQITEFAENGWI